MRIQKERGTITHGWKTSAMNNKVITCYLMLAIPFTGFVVLSVYPILWTFRWAFFTYTGIPSETHFVGLQNLIHIFCRDAVYWLSWVNTFLFAVAKVPIELTIAMLLALMISGKRFGKNFFRSMFYLPSVISVAIIGLIFSNMFTYFGWVNGILINLGLVDSPIEWFASKGTSFAVLIIGSIWNTFGINVMYFCAALAGVSESVYESATLDGAKGFVRFFKITLPMIAPVFKIVVLLSIVGTLSVNDYVLALTNGMPGGQTHTVMSYLTTQFMPGFMSVTTPNIGYGCSLSLITTLLFAIVAVAYNKLSTNNEGKGKRG